MTAFNQTVFDPQIRQFPGSFKFTKVTVSGVDMSDWWVQIDLFDGVFNSSESARITIIDTANHIVKIPILGEEKVEIEVTDGVKERKFVGRVYKITDRQAINHGSLKYVLHCCTEEAWLDSFVRVSKSYMNQPLEKVVESIVRDPKFLNSQKELLLGKTDGARSVIIPNWSPIHGISWCAGRALAEETIYRGGVFVYFETMQRINWLSLDNLLDDKMNKPYATLKYDPMRQSLSGRTAYDERVPRDLLRFEDFQVLELTDSLRNSRAGMYANTTRVIDVVERKFEDKTYNYLREFYGRQHLKGLGGVAARPISSWDHDAQHHQNANYRVALKHKGLFTTEPDGNSRIDEWLPQKISQMRQLENFKLVGSLPGHIGLTSGMLIDFAMPNPQDVSVTSAPGVDQSMSGQYLVSATRSMFQRDKFTLFLELVKDSRGGDGNTGV